MYPSIYSLNRAIVIAIILLLFPLSSFANDLSLNNIQTTTIGYQGYLSDSNGDPLNGQYSMKFELLVNAEDVDYLWQETLTVDIVEGKFNVYLGETVTINELTIEQANFLKIYVNNEPLTPPTKLTSIPTSIVSSSAKSLSGEVKTSGASLYVPGSATSPKTVELTRSGDNGQVGIWGTDGTGIPQLELKGTSYGGNLTMYPGHDWISGPTKAINLSVETDGGMFGIWGTDGTGIPQLELKGTSYGGNLTMYPGHDWISGPTKALDLSVNSGGGVIGIWGTDGTSMPQLELKGTSTGGQVGIWGTNGTSFPQIDLSTSPDGGILRIYGVTASNMERVEIESGDGGSSLALYASDGSLTVGLAGDSGGGLISLKDDNDNSTIFLDGAGVGDASVNIPDNAINASEMLNEPGLAQGHSSTCVDITSTTMQDVTTVQITIPTNGYIFVNGSGEVEFGGTTASNRMDVQIDETSGGATNSGLFSRIGLSGYSSSSYNSFDFNVTRVYYKTAGTYTFRLEARRLSITSGTGDICFGTITAFFFPTSYGTVSTVAENGNGDEFLSDKTAPSYETTETIDLRNLEIRAKEARQKALEAELELANARMKK